MSFHKPYHFLCFNVFALTCLYLRPTPGLEHKPHGSRDLPHLVPETASHLKQCLEHRRPSRQKLNMTALHAHFLFSTFLDGLLGCMNFPSSQTLLRKHSTASCPKAQWLRGIQVASGHLAGADQKLSGAYGCCGLRGMPSSAKLYPGFVSPRVRRHVC